MVHLREKAECQQQHPGFTEFKSDIVRAGYMGVGVLISTDGQNQVPHSCVLSQLPICTNLTFYYSIKYSNHVLEGLNAYYDKQPKSFSVRDTIGLDIGTKNHFTVHLWNGDQQ